MVKTVVIIILALLNLTCFCTTDIPPCLANNFLTVDATADKDSITIGEPIEYAISVKRAGKTKVKPLVFGNKLGAFEVKELKMGKEKRYGSIFQDRDDYFISKTILILTIFDVGSFTIPPVKVEYVDDEGNRGEVYTKKFNIIVKSLVPVDATDIKGFKGPAEMPAPFFKTLLFRVGFYGSIFITVLATVLLIYYRWSKRWTLAEKVATPEKGIPKPPHQIALEELDRIDSLNLLRNGCVEEFYVFISEVIRYYIESRYNIGAIQKDTEEIIGDIRSISLEDNITETIEIFLKECDLVKFARSSPRRNESQNALEMARRIVRITSSPTLTPTP